MMGRVFEVDGCRDRFRTGLSVLTYLLNDHRDVSLYNSDSVTFL